MLRRHYYLIVFLRCRALRDVREKQKREYCVFHRVSNLELPSTATNDPQWYHQLNHQERSAATVVIGSGHAHGVTENVSQQIVR